MVFDKNVTVDYGVNITNIKKADGLTIFYTKNGCAYQAVCNTESSPIKVRFKGKYSYCKQVAPFTGNEIRVFTDSFSVV